MQLLIQSEKNTYNYEFEGQVLTDCDSLGQ